MPDGNHPTTSGREPETIGKRRLSTWQPISDGFLLSPPVDWRCPCGTLLAGNKSCPECGRVPMDQAATSKPNAIKMRQWRKFGRRR
ncbi:MAG: hypothetical protein ABR985_15700 [Methanotrichaceae archaeon]